MIKNNYHRLMNPVFYANEEKKIEIKSFWEERDLTSQKRYSSYAKNFFQNF